MEMYIMTDLKGTKTEANLQAAFAGESSSHKIPIFCCKS